jgi:hypothetical protein
MILTELEARGDKEKGIEGKQCRAVPLVLVTSPTNSALVGGPQKASYVPSICAASACMLWRWAPGSAGGHHARGYCGAGGVPIE